MEELVFVADIGGTLTKCALVHSDHQIVKKSSFATQKDDADQHLSSVLDQYIRWSQDHKINDHVGIAAPSAVATRGTIEHSPNLNWPEIYPLAEKFMALLEQQASDQQAKRPVLMNDANAAALGEKSVGVAQAMESFVVLTLGTGLGAGIVINGTVLEGAHGKAGEFGHIKTAAGDVFCGCGKRGCLETEVSATALRRHAFTCLEEQKHEGPLRELAMAKQHDLSGEDIFNAAEAGDACALKAFDLVADPLGDALVSLVLILDPEAVILAGGLANAGELLRSRVESAFHQRATAEQRRTKILLSGVEGGDASLHGLAYQVRRHAVSRA